MESTSSLPQPPRDPSPALPEPPRKDMAEGAEGSKRLPSMENGDSVWGSLTLRPTEAPMAPHPDDGGGAALRPAPGALLTFLRPMTEWEDERGLPTTGDAFGERLAPIAPMGVDEGWGCSIVAL